MKRSDGYRNNTGNSLIFISDITERKRERGELLTCHRAAAFDRGHSSIPIRNAAATQGSYIGTLHSSPRRGHSSLNISASLLSRQVGQSSNPVGI